MIRDLASKVSCVTVTSGRVEHVKSSTHCYLSQTYPNRELIILSQGDENSNQAISDYVSSLGRDDILFLSASPSLTLGAMRNSSCELANRKSRKNQAHPSVACHPTVQGHQEHP